MNNKTSKTSINYSLQLLIIYSIWKTDQESAINKKYKYIVKTTEQIPEAKIAPKNNIKSLQDTIATTPCWNMFFSLLIQKKIKQVHMIA